jgi:high affinity Mn2+ porin
MAPAVLLDARPGSHVDCVSRRWAALILGVVVSALAAVAWADEPPAAAASEDWAIHAQSTFTEQANLAFASPYVGPYSLNPSLNGRETWDLTVFGGARPWRGAEIWINPEIDQGFGLSNTLGVAGFPSGEAYKVGDTHPYVRLQQFFLRQTFDLGGDNQHVDGTANQLAGAQSADRIVITVGKFAVTSIFDANDYAHDPRHDFMNWSIIDTGAFDYAADAWGYTAGGAIEWYRGPWTLRGAFMDESVAPNSPILDPHFGQWQMIGEGERRWTIAGESGAAKVTGFWTHARMGDFAAAIALGEATRSPASDALVRTMRGRGGFSFEAQQQLTGALGVFARAGIANGDLEPFAFTDIDQSVALGLSLKGKSWKRPDDTIGVAGVNNAITAEHTAYFAAGGLGVLVGDGRLPHPGDEHILESFYDVSLNKYLHMALDYQLIANPGYNRDRGPVNVFAARLHAQF